MSNDEQGFPTLQEELNNIMMAQCLDYPISTWKDVEVIPPLASNNEDPPVRKLFVGNVHRRSTYRDLVHLFTSYGRVKHAHVSRNKYTNTKRGYGFVTFETPEDAELVLNLPKGELQLHDRTLYVAPADSWHQPTELPDGTVVWHSKDQKRNPSSTEGSEDGKTIEADVSDSDDAATEPAAEEPQDDQVDNVDDGTVRIQVLNDDCLMHVFSFLSKMERIKIERVCKRWQQVSWKMWMSQKHLDFRSLFHPPSRSYLTCHVLSAFLQRCGQNLKSLDLSHKPNDLGNQACKLVAKYCRQLERLDLAGLPVTNASLRSLYPVVGQLRFLSLDGCHGASDRDLLNLFYKCTNLESLILSQHHNLTGKCLIGLANAPLKQLVVDDCNNLRSNFLVRGLSNLCGLSDLSLNACISLTSSDVSDIVKAVPNLLHLSMRRYFPLFSNSALLPLSKLRNLLVLDLQLNQVVNDQVMHAIANSCCNIHKLNITACSVNSWETPSLTDDGLRCVSKLPHLVDLSMSYLANVTDEALIALAEKGRIKRLECRGCPTFTDTGCSRVVASCNELEHFDLSGCDVVTEVTVKAALEAVKLRANNTKLLLIVGGSSVRNPEKLGSHPLLEVDTKDFCIPHLRPDFVDEIYFPSSEHDEDDFCEIDWETHSMLFGDDIEYYEDLFEDEDYEEACAYAHFGFYQ